MRHIYLIFLLFSLHLSAQNSMPLLLSSDQSIPAVNDMGVAVPIPVEVNESMLMKLFGQDQTSIAVTLENERWTLDLRRTEVLSPDILINTASGNELSLETTFFTGKVTGEEHSLVSASIINGEFQLSIQANGKAWSVSKGLLGGYYALREDKVQHGDLGSCKTNTDGYVVEEISTRSSTKSSDNCVKIYFEVDFDVYQRLGTAEKAATYFMQAFNEVNTLFQNEKLNVQISEIFVWDIPSPYLGFSSLGQLQQFQALRPTYNGDLAHLVDFRTSNGGIAYVDVLCAATGYAYSGCEPTFKNVPTYSWTVEVITHEIGHNLGSPHTHDCSWSQGALDNCQPPSGNCDPGPTPDNGGTIMSYCHLTEHGINFENGFGPVPGDFIRQRVANANCLVPCEAFCAVPNGLQQTNAGDNTFTVSWLLNSAAQKYLLEYRRTGVSSWTELVTTNTSEQVNGLQNNSEYEVRVSSVCNDSLSSAPSLVVKVQTGVNPEVYCPSNGRNSNSEWINRVEIGSFENSSGNDNGYADFTNQTINLFFGVNTEYTLSPGFTGGLLGPNRYPEYWKIWIDLNRDGDFLDANELVMDPGGTSDQDLEGTFVVPRVTSAGLTRMRISMKYNAAAGPCEEFSEGEVEDYRVNLQESSTGINGNEDLDFVLYPNPSKGLFTLELTRPFSGELQVLNPAGQKVAKKSVEASLREDIDLSNMAKGVYFLVLNSTDGTKQNFVRKLVVQ